MLPQEVYDITIHVNEGDAGVKIFKAHKHYLTKHSGYLRALLGGPPGVKKNEDNIELKGVSVIREDDTIYIKGVTAKSFESIMYFIYPSRSLGYRSIWNLSDEEEFDVLHTAEIFEVAGLKELMKKVVCGRLHDVTFQVVDGLGEVREFKAHKKYLASVNEYFKAMFYGPLGATKDTIEVKGVTAKSFEIIIYYIYPSYDYQHKLEQMSVEELFDVVNAAEMFDVAGMKEMVKKVLREKPMNLTNVLELAYAAEQFSVFTDVSQTLYDTCVSFLCQSLEARVLDFSGLLFYEEHKESLSRLFSSTMEKPPPLPEPICTGGSCAGDDLGSAPCGCTHYSCWVKKALALEEDRRMKHALDFYAAVMPASQP